MPARPSFAERNAGKIAVTFYAIQPIDHPHEDVMFEDVGDALHISRLPRLTVLHLFLDWLEKRNNSNRLITFAQTSYIASSSMAE